MRLTERLTAFVLASLILPFGAPAFADHGLGTRDMNPMLQPVYIPGYTQPRPDDGGWVDHNLFITNTSDLKSNDDEQLTIDVENYRYELDLGYRRQDWVMQVSIPYMVNTTGELDSVIDSWHEFWGLPEGNRDDRPDDQILIEYVRDGETVYSQRSSSKGLADIAISFAYHPADSTGYYLGLEVPTGDADEFTSNDALDWAAWIAGGTHLDEDMAVHGMFGISFPGDDGPLEGLLVERIYFAQAGFDYRFSDRIVGIAQLDLHSAVIEDTDMRALGNSMQIQLGLGITGLVEDRRLDLFFSEDIAVGTAPDITFGARLAQDF